MSAARGASRERRAKRWVRASLAQDVLWFGLVSPAPFHQPFGPGALAAPGTKWQRPVIALSVVAALSAASRESRAESSVPPCVPMRVVEVFAGTATCPQASYVVLETLKPAWGPTAPIVSLDHCGGAADVFSNQTASMPTDAPRALVARPEAAAAFNVTADVVAAGQIPLFDGWIEYDCPSVFTLHRRVIYGAFPAAVAPALVPGKALKWNGTSWELGEPTPKNAKGDLGALDASCLSASDAGDAADSGDAEASSDAQTDDANPSDATVSDAKTYPPCTGTGGSNSGGTGGGPNSGGGGNGGDDAGVGTGAAPTDAGLARAVSDDGGCSCRSAGETPRRGTTLALLALAAFCTRRRSRVRGPA